MARRSSSSSRLSSCLIKPHLQGVVVQFASGNCGASFFRKRAPAMFCADEQQFFDSMSETDE